MQRFVYRLQTNNNARANFFWLLWLGTLILKWITCPAGWEDHVSGFSTVLKNRHLWTASDVCDWCTPYIMRETYCNALAAAVTYGFFIAAAYWVIAHLDDVARCVARLLHNAAASRRTSTSESTSDTQNPPRTSSTSTITREIFVEFVAEALWDLLKNRRRR